MPVEAGYKQGSGIRESAACSNHGLYCAGPTEGELGKSVKLVHKLSVVRVHSAQHFGKLRRFLPNWSSILRIIAL